MKRGGEGLSLIEVVIAVAFFSLVAAALFNLLGGSYIGLNSSSSYQKALFYAQEGAEAVRSIRNQAWNNLAVGTYGLSSTTGRWQFSGSSELIDNFFTRKIIIEDVYRDGAGNIVLPTAPEAVLDIHTKKIASQVFWQTQAGNINQINLPFYLSSWQTKNWIQTDWQSGPGQLIWSNPAQFFSDDGNIDYGVAGEIKLKQSGPPVPVDSFGNRFLVDSLNTSVRLNASTKKASLRFTAQQTKNVNQIRVYINTRSNPPTYRFGLQADNGYGNPSGTYLGYGNSSPGTTGWLAITLNQSVALVGGQTYHLVIQWQSGTISSSRYIILRQTSPLNNLISYNQVSDPQSNVLFSSNNGVSWQTLGLQPLYHLTFTDITYEGNSYDNLLASSNIYGANFRGQFFIAASTKQFSEISFYVRRQGGNQPLDDLRFTIFNITNNTQLLSGILARRQDVTTVYQWFSYSFAQSITFEAGKNYRLYLSSPGANSTNYYRVAGVLTTNQAILKAITFAGTTSYYQYSTNGGGSWSSQDYTDLNFILRLNLPSYAPQGELVSSAFNTDAPAAFDFLSWQEIIPSPNTDIWVQLATAPDNAGLPGEWGPWQGPTGLGSYYQSGVEQLIPVANNHNDNQFVRYKVILRSDSTETPVFQEIKINYTP